MLVQTAVSWIRHRKVSGMLLTSAVLVLVFGGLTLLIHDATFIKWKPTIVNWLFAAAFLASQYMRGQPIIQRMLGENVTLDAAGLEAPQLHVGRVLLHRGRRSTCTSPTISTKRPGSTSSCSA